MIQTCLTIAGTVLLGIITNEFCDLAPWLAKRLLRPAARLWTGKDLSLGLDLEEEWAAVIEECPGKLIKLVQAINFLAAAAHRANMRWLTDMLRYGFNKVLQNVELPSYIRIVGWLGSGCALAMMGAAAGRHWLMVGIGLTLTLVGLLELAASLYRRHIRKRVKALEARAVDLEIRLEALMNRMSRR